METLAYTAGVEAALEKFAATRGLKEVRNAIIGGNWDRANQLAKTPGVLRRGNIYGSELADLGMGGEGLATLVAHPKHGVSVRKTYDPRGGVYSPEIIKRKEQLGSVPGTADFYGKSVTKQNTPVHFSEFVRGKTVNADVLANTPGASSAYMKALMQARRAGRQQGFHLADMRGVNAKMTPDGQVKFIDHMPLKPNEVEANSLMRQFRQRGQENMLSSTPEAAAKLFRPKLQDDPFVTGKMPDARMQDDLGGFKRRMFGRPGMPQVPPIARPVNTQPTVVGHKRTPQPLAANATGTFPPGDSL